MHTEILHQAFVYREFSRAALPTRKRLVRVSSLALRGVGPGRDYSRA